MNLKLHDKIVVTIEGYNHRGEGVTRWQGFTLFVPFTIVGEEMEIEITTVKKNYGVGSIQSISKPSPARIIPRCPVFGICGGCQLQHIDYCVQGEIKTQIVVDALSRIAGMKNLSCIQPIILADQPWYYRNKAQIPVAAQNGKMAMGFYQRGTHWIVETPECFIQQQKNNDVIREIRDIIDILKINPYDERSGSGDLRHVVVRHSEAENQTMIVFVTSKRDFAGKGTLFQMVQERIDTLASLYQNVQSGKSNVIMGTETELVYGNEVIQDRIGPFIFNLSPHSFFQVNPEQTEKIYETVMKFADPQENEVIIDAYCGIGTIALYLAQRAGHVHGIEIVPEAIEDAVINADMNRVGNVSFHSGEVEVVLPRLRNEGVVVQTVVVDPPRKGCEPGVIETIDWMDVKKVVYVSCNPATLARDIKDFNRRGYLVESVQPIDQFPNTSHVEMVVLMSRVKG